MHVTIPGYKTLTIDKLVFDFNGTLAVDGKIADDVRNRLHRLAKDFDLYVLTADTYGTVKETCSGLPVTVEVFPGSSAADGKLSIVNQLGASSCACIGNGRNDAAMFEASALSVAVFGREGTYGPLLLQADVCTASITDALDLFLYPARLIADLRG